MDLTGSTPVNNLWPSLVNRVGLEKSHKAVQQALDLQSMQGDNNTLPVLFFETCGLALTTFENLRLQIGLPIKEDRLVLLFSPKKRSIQLLRDLRD